MATLRTLREHYRDSHSVEAIHALDDPSALTTLPRRDSSDIILQLFFIPSFEPITSWTIYRARESSAYVRRVRWDFSKDYRVKTGSASVFAADGIISKDRLDSILNPMNELAFTPFWPSEMITITDGESYGIRRLGHDQLAEVWWSYQPERWESVAKWYTFSLNLLDGCLPMSTESGEREASHRFASTNAESRKSKKSWH